MNKSGNLTTTLYVIGVIIALVMGVGKAMGSSWGENAWLTLILVVIGLVVGFYNISQKEVTPFLLGTVALAIASAIANLGALDTLIPKLGTFIEASLANFVMVVGAAAVVVAFKAVASMAK